MESESKSTDFRRSLHGFSYDETVAAEPPIHVTSTASPHLIPSPTRDHNKSLEDNRENPTNTTSTFFDNAQNPEIEEESGKTQSEDLNTLNLGSASSIPQILVGEEESRPARKWLSRKSSKPSSPEHQATPALFEKLAISIPSGGFGDDLSEAHVRFSQRGSMLVDGRKISNPQVKNASLEAVNDQEELQNGRDQPKTTQARPELPHSPFVKVLSTDENALSEKVRSYYAFGSEIQHDTDATSSVANKMGLRWQDALGGTNTEASSVASLSRGTSTTDIHSEVGSQQNGSRVSSIQKDFLREATELAGGIEDWSEVDNADVDRYGFIVPKPEIEPNGLTRSLTTKQLTRVSTSLQLASETPRRKHTLRRTPSMARSVRSTSGPLPPSTSQQSLRRPSSAHSAHTGLTRHSTFRSRDRKLMDGASDMLTLPRSASNLSTNDAFVSAADDPRARRTEVQREEKWRKMAKTMPASSQKLGGGMTFTFDTTSPKLIERTWKGIPDKWRATAWHAFLSASAKKAAGSLADEELATLYADYQHSSSPDDVQIDIDVPRTISSHIMFRRRYRGGQRLLFRVLHAMSLHFPETGYVQGMAALAATLLSYYSEENAFIMLVRLWELRGLEKLYRNGFGGLMAALGDFETKWLGKGEIGKKLEELGIPPTSYGTKWYLTLFNYSIPFPAQLRVWDVFMLLGDDTSPVKPKISNARGSSAGTLGEKASNGATASSSSNATSADDEQNFGTTLDVLHATSAALIDGMRDILLESDFENGMKVLTSWIPIKDEDLFMRVARAEWKLQKKKMGVN